MPNTNHVSTAYAKGLQNQVAKGVLRNNVFATNFSMAFFQNPNAFASRSIFPVVPVAQDTGRYAIFNREDLARVNAARKPQGGSVTGFTVTNDEDTYSVDVYQTILLFDMIEQTKVDRSGIVGASNVMKSKARIVAEQLAILQDILFANKFFKEGAWDTEYTGKESGAGANEFLHFADANFEPIKFFDNLKTEMHEKTGREPNKLLLGRKAYNALRENPDLRERISGSSSKAAPAIISYPDLCKLLEIEQIHIFGSSYNAAPVGQPADYKYIADPTAALLCYAPNSPAIDEPSCGYSFTWDMLGNGQYAPIFVRERNDATHTMEMEALLATSHKKTCDDLGIFLKNCCAE